MTTLQDVIGIPTAVQKSDFVMALKDGVAAAQATLNTYVVTPQLAGCLDDSLALIGSAVGEGSSKGTYLHGSFGSGKSHFMAVLHLLLDGNDHARAKPELAPVIAKHDERLKGRQFLLIPYRLIGADSLEQAVLGGYVDHVRTLHPDAPLPAIFAGDQILTDAKGLRNQLGDQAFFDGLGGAGDVDGFGAFAAGWIPADYDAAVAAGPSSPDGRRLIADLVATYFTAYQRQGDLVDFDTGLGAISQHARDLGYDGVVLFLDELILWLATHLANTEFVATEASKLATLVEASRADRPIPLISFIARQRDLSDFLGVGLPGAEKHNFTDVMQHFSGRFGVIELADTNLPEIVSRRLLTPKGEAERQQLDHAFDTVWQKASAARDTLITSHGDRDTFRRVYPFSPALIDTLVAVSGYLQRERTALRLLLQILVDKRDTLQVGDLVPLGDLWDQIAGEDAFSVELKATFTRARGLYRRLHAMLLGEHGLTEEQAADLPDGHTFRTDDRLLKTLLLSALVPEVEPLRNLTVSRLAALNHGTIRSPIPGQERTVVLNKLTKWASEVPEIRVEEGHDPLLSLKLTGVDTTAILDAARTVDTAGGRRAKVRELVAGGLGVQLEASLLPTTHKWVWRGSRREVEIRFGNVRNPADLPDSELRSGDIPRLVIDFPFDEPGFGPADDRARITTLREEGMQSDTVCWLPRFLTDRAQQRLGDLVALDHILQGDRFEQQTAHLSPTDRSEARTLLRGQAEQLRNQMRVVLQQAYGLTTADEDLVQTSLSVGEQFISLDPTLDVRPPTAGNLLDALPQVLDQIMAHRHPSHPQFEDEVRPAELKTCLALLTRAVTQPSMRLDGIPTGDRKAMRKVLGPLKLATTGEAHLVVDRHWLDHFHRQATQAGGPVTVERLRAWLDVPRTMGLDPKVGNLVICAYALVDDRVMVHGGAPVEPNVDRMDDAVELRTQTLPEEEDWQAAVPRAAAIFGVTGSPIRNAANVASLISQVRTVATEHREAARQLAARLEAAAGSLGLTSDADRLQTARAARDLLDDLAGGEDHEAVRALARAQVPTSAEALGTSIKSAATVSARLDRYNADLVAGAVALTDERRTAGQGIVQVLADRAAKDELAIGLANVLDQAERAATDLLTRPAPQPPPRDPDPVAVDAPETGSTSVPDDRVVAPVAGETLPIRGQLQAAGSQEARILLQRLLAEADDLDELSVRWKKTEP